MVYLLAQAQQELGKEAIVIASDASRVDEQKRLAEEITKVFDQLDVVFLNAGVAVFHPLADWDETGFDQQMALNFKGPYFLMQSLLPLCGRQSG